jgi:hypothetical protein
MALSHTAPMPSAPANRCMSQRRSSTQSASTRCAVGGAPPRSASAATSAAVTRAGSGSSWCSAIASSRSPVIRRNAT